MRLSVDSLGELFETLDPAPHHERDLDAHAEHFLVSWAQGLPRDVPLRLTIQVAQCPADPDSALSVEHAVRHHFRELERLTRQEFGALLREGRIALAIGLGFLIACVTGGNALAGLIGDATWSGIVRETFLIGGWVAMWRPLQIYLYDWWPLKSRQRLYRRMGTMQVRLRPAKQRAARARVTPPLVLGSTRSH
jgi:hypothetical protein